MKRTRKVYSAEFKANAVELVRAGIKDITRIARELDVSRQLLHRWARQSERHAGKVLSVFPGRGKRTTEQTELDRLQRENEELRISAEISIITKTFFAQYHD